VTKTSISCCWPTGLPVATGWQLEDTRFFVEQETITTRERCGQKNMYDHKRSSIRHHAKATIRRTYAWHVIAVGQRPDETMWDATDDDT
jgi:hypothetical protein